MNVVVPAPRNLPTLTGLRFLAALLVFSRHAETLFDGTRLAHVTRHVFFQGTIGVSFFFVLSGFVLTWSRRDGDTARAFYRRRFARIYPNYVVAWVLGGAVAAWIGSLVTIGIAASTFVLLQSWIPRQDYFLGMDGVS